MKSASQIGGLWTKYTGLVESADEAGTNGRLQRICRY